MAAYFPELDFENLGLSDAEANSYSDLTACAYSYLRSGSWRAKQPPNPSWTDMPAILKHSKLS